MITFDSFRTRANGHYEGGIPGGPMKLTLPHAIIKLLTFGLQPGDIVQQTETKIVTSGGIMGDTDVSTFEGTPEEIRLMFFAAQYFCAFVGKKLSGESYVPHIYWERTFRNLRYADQAAKVAMFLAINDMLYGEQFILDFSPYDIDDLADALEIVNTDRRYTLDMLRPAMFEVAPHKRMR